MKTIRIIFFTVLTALPMLVFSQFAYNSESPYNFESSNNSNSNDNSSITTLESVAVNLDILQLNILDPSDLQFSLLQDAKKANLVLTSNFPIHGMVEYAIYNSDGEEINRNPIANEKAMIDISGLDSGTYILHIYLSAEKFQVFRIKKL